MLEWSSSEPTSNMVILNGYAWIYLINSQELVRTNGSAITHYSVTGGSISSSCDVYLSVCGKSTSGKYSVYLNQGTSNVELAVNECATFDPSTDVSLQLVFYDARTVRGTITNESTVYTFFPMVIQNSSSLDSRIMISYTSEGYDGVCDTITVGKTTWTAGSGSFSSSKLFSGFNITDGWHTIRSASTSGGKDYLRMYHLASECALLFNYKNNNEMICPTFALAYSGLFALSHDPETDELYIMFNFSSGLGGTYGNFRNYETNLGLTNIRITSVDSPYYQRFGLSNTPLPMSIWPIAAQGEYLYSAEVTSRHLTIYYGTYSPATVFQMKTIPIILPSNATLFLDSVVYASVQRVWLIFVGTGILFTSSLALDDWGYVDTRGDAEAIYDEGGIAYDASNNNMYIYGRNVAGVPVVYELDLSTALRRAINGAYLPSISAGGVPAYIKALEPSEA